MEVPELLRLVVFITIVLFYGYSVAFLLHSWCAEPESQQAVTSAPVGTAVWSVFTSGLVQVEGYRWCFYR